MAFFLIGRGPDDDLRLLSPKLLESRQAAMAELSRLSADPSFDQWDAEVSVMDLTAGVPVLLVRPAAPPVSPEQTPAVDTGQTGFADAWEADLPAAEIVPAVALVDVAEPLAEMPVEIPDAIEAPSWEPPTVALIEPVGDIAIADAIVAEVEQPTADVEAYTFVQPETESEPEPAAPLESDTEGGGKEELRAAIERTTEQMTAEGIVAPESIGPEVVSADDVEFTDQDSLQPEEPAAEVAVEPEFEAAAQPFAPDIEAFAEEPAPIAEPAVDAVTAEPEAPVEATPVRAARAFWPWDKSGKEAESQTGVAPEVAGVYDALEEPAHELPEPDVEAALRYPVMSDGTDSETVDTAAPREPMSSIPEADVVQPGATLEAPASESDFILDLESVERPSTEVEATDATVEAVDSDVQADPTTQIEEVPPAAETPIDQPQTDTGESPILVIDKSQPSAAASPLEDYTCADCVYVDTCPNRDQRLPKDCGSFQWR